MIESLGAQAIATTSAGVAWAAGYPDGNQMPASLVLSVSESIARVIKVPLSVDIEGGYSSDPAQVAALVVRLADRGIVGVNLEYGTEEADLLARKIGAAKEVLAKTGLAVFINTRSRPASPGRTPVNTGIARLQRPAWMACELVPYQGPADAGSMRPAS